MAVSQAQLEDRFYNSVLFQVIVQLTRRNSIKRCIMSICLSVCLSVCHMAFFTQNQEVIAYSNFIERLLFSRVTSRTVLQSKGQRSRPLLTKICELFLVRLHKYGSVIQFSHTKPKWSSVHSAHIIYPAKCILLFCLSIHCAFRLPVLYQ